MSLLIGNTENRPDDLPRDPAHASARAAWRAIVFAAMYHRQADEFGSVNIGPRVLVNCFTRVAEVPTVLPDDEEGGHAVGEHLLCARPSAHRLSHLVAGHRGDAAAAVPDCARAFAEAGVAFPDDLVATGADPRRALRPAGGFRSGAQAACSRATVRPPSSAATTRWRCRSTTPPRRSACAFPMRSPSSATTTTASSPKALRPALTTVALPYQQMGRVAADLLLQHIAIRRARSARLIRVEGPLSHRASTAAVPARRRRMSKDTQRMRKGRNWMRLTTLLLTGATLLALGGARGAATRSRSGTTAAAATASARKIANAIDEWNAMHPGHAGGARAPAGGLIQRAGPGGGPCRRPA